MARVMIFLPFKTIVWQEPISKVSRARRLNKQSKQKIQKVRKDLNTPREPYLLMRVRNLV